MEANTAMLGPKANEHTHSDPTRNVDFIILSRKESAASTSTFEIIEFCKSSSISISLEKYLRLNPKELDKLVQYVKGEPWDNAQFTDNVVENQTSHEKSIFISEGMG